MDENYSFWPCSCAWVYCEVYWYTLVYRITTVKIISWISFVVFSQNHRTCSMEERIEYYIILITLSAIVQCTIILSIWNWSGITSEHVRCAALLHKTLPVNYRSGTKCLIKYRILAIWARLRRFAVEFCKKKRKCSVESSIKLAEQKLFDNENTLVCANNTPTYVLQQSLSYIIIILQL
jgi:hypothetical protein